MLQLSVVLVKLILVINAVFGKFSEYGAIDVEDILSLDYMPGSLLLLENADEQEGYVNMTNLRAAKFQDSDIHNGSFPEAFSTMGYHRTMMNEYMCRTYLSTQILSDISSTRIKRRLGNPALNVNSKIKDVIRNNLLEDEGSETYKEWLKKSATLEDIYRHYEEEPNEVEDRNTMDNDVGTAKEGNQGFQGHITGFAYDAPPVPIEHSPSKAINSGPGGGFQHTGLGAHGSTGGGTYGYGPGPGHSGYGGGDNGNAGTYYGGTSNHGSYDDGHAHGPPEHPQVYVEKHHHYVKHNDRSGKESLTELFEIAMTAIALLAFKLFLIHVIMCLCATNTTTTTAATMMPMSMSPTGETGGGSMMMGDGDMMVATESTNGGTGDGGNGEGNGGTEDGGGDGGNGTDEGGGGTDEGGGGTDDGAAGGDDGGGTEEGGGSAGEGGGGTGDGGGDATGGGNAGADNGGTTGEGSAGTGTGTGTATGGDGTGGGGTAEGVRDQLVFRQRRQIFTLVQPNNQALNEMARKVLVSIEAALIAHQDDGLCLQRVLCENNKDSRLDDNQKYWIPAWSIGMSWISGRIIKNAPSTASMFSSLKASVLGLGNADCEMLYSNCNLAEQRDKNRNRRKKRSTGKQRSNMS